MATIILFIKFVKMLLSYLTMPTACTTQGEKRMVLHLSLVTTNLGRKVKQVAFRLASKSIGYRGARLPHSLMQCTLEYQPPCLLALSGHYGPHGMDLRKSVRSSAFSSQARIVSVFMIYVNFIFSASDHFFQGHCDILFSAG